MEKIYSNEIIKAFPIFQAVKDGKTIQTIDEMGYWYDLDLDEDGLSLETLINSPRNYRIKPEQKYRPFKDAEECWKEMLKHQPFGWVKCKGDGSLGLITLIINEESIYINSIGSNSERTMREFTFADGAAFGILEEE